MSARAWTNAQADAKPIESPRDALTRRLLEVNPKDYRTSLTMLAKLSRAHGQLARAVLDQEKVREAAVDLAFAAGEMALPLIELTELFGHMVAIERQRQDDEWGADRDIPLAVWVTIAGEEVGEVADDVLEHNADEALLIELVQVAAVAVAMCESLRAGRRPERDR